MSGEWKVYTFKAPNHLIEHLDRVAREKKITRGEAIRQAIAMYVKLESNNTGYSYKYVRLDS